MIRGHILSELTIKILEADRKLEDHFIRLLCDCIELAEKLSLGYISMEKFEESRANFLKHRKFPEIVAGIPSCCGSIAILDESLSAAVRRCVKWLACHVNKKVRMCDSV